MIYNHENNSCIWYHSTLKGLASKILREGLMINSIPTFQSSSEPRIYVSTHPFTCDKDFVTFKVDLSKFSMSFSNGAADMKKGVDAGIKAMAKS
jgi:hypothetical protein